MGHIRELRRGLLGAVGLLAFSMVVASSQPEPKQPADSKERRVRELIGQLDHGTFQQREQATKELKQLGRSIIPHLEAALEQAASLEVQRRLQQVLDWYRVRPEWHTDRAEFVKRLRNRVHEINFDDLDTSRAETVSFPADRYAKKYGIIITGDGGQYTSRTFGFPDQYPSVSAPNLFAPGPMAHRNAAGGAAGGFRTDVTFTVGGQPAAAAGFAAVFIDPDHPDIGPSSLRVYDRLGKSLGEPRVVSGGNASQVFCGVLAVDGAGNLVPAIGRIHLVNGRNWPGVNEGEGTALDDFLFGEPCVNKMDATSPSTTALQPASSVYSRTAHTRTSSCSSIST
jgi:hypothetical protein